MNKDYARPLATVDVVLLTVSGSRLSVLLVRRPGPGIGIDVPYQGQMSLPGTVIHSDQRFNCDRDTDDSARRVLREKLGIQVPYMEQLQTFSGPTRDPRGWSVSVAYVSLLPEVALALPDGIDAHLFPVDDLPPMAFDHRDIVLAAAGRIRGKADYSNVPAFLLDEGFTMAQLQRAYEDVKGVQLDRNTFRRKMEAMGFVEEIPGRRSSGGQHRPAQLYRVPQGTPGRLPLGVLGKRGST